MEKLSKATRDFAEALKHTQEDIQEAIKNDDALLPKIVRAAKLLTKPKNIPNAILAYGITKESSVEIQEDIPSLSLYDFLMENFGSEWITWTPETIRKSVFDKSGNEVLENKIQALATCLSTDTPWNEWHIFENVGKSFSHQVPIFGLIQPLSPGECAVAMEVMSGLREPDEVFSREVLIYIATCCYMDNLVYLPSEMQLSLAQVFLDDMSYNLDLKQRVQSLWDKLKDSPKLLELDIDDTDPVQVQVGKLAILKQYLKENVR